MKPLIQTLVFVVLSLFSLAGSATWKEYNADLHICLVQVNPSLGSYFDVFVLPGEEPHVHVLNTAREERDRKYFSFTFKKCMASKGHTVKFIKE